jgi:hypothetical protein
MHNDTIEEEGAAPEEVAIDFEERLPSRMTQLPTTPGSLYGGSRNIMKNQIRSKQ